MAFWAHTKVLWRTSSTDVEEFVCWRLGSCKANSSRKKWGEVGGLIINFMFFIYTIIYVFDWLAYFYYKITSYIRRGVDSLDTYGESISRTSKDPPKLAKVNWRLISFEEHERWLEDELQWVWIGLTRGSFLDLLAMSTTSLTIIIDPIYHWLKKLKYWWKYRDGKKAEYVSNSVSKCYQHQIWRSI